MDIPLKTNTICPIFYKKRESEALEQIGSSVVVRIKDCLFLLTVAHITDFLKHGFLFIPAFDGFVQLHGNYSSFKLPTGYKREDDKIDIAYFKLNNEIASCLHPNIQALERNDLNVTESLVENDIYTFSGYPISKAKRRGMKYTSQIFKFTGSAVSKAEYEKLGYDNFFHILVHFNRKNSCTTAGKKQMAPHPKGISGGAVFSWPKDIKTRNKEPVFNFVGIGHTYKEKYNCFVATRVHSYLASIYQNNPELIDIPLEQVQYSKSIPMFVGIAWYKQEEWRQATESGLEYMARNNKIMYPVELEADYIKAYCSENNLPNTSKTRVRIVNEILGAIILEKEI